MAQADSAMSTHEWDRAIALFKQAVRRADPSKDPVKANKARYFLAYCYFSSGGYYEAAVLADHLAKRYAQKEFSDKAADFGLEVQPAQTQGHAWLLREMLLNLVDNAVKYTPVGGRITLRCGELPQSDGESTRAWLEVEDDGPGIPADEHERVLQRFYRVPGTAGEGNGLGLAIAHEIARAHRIPLQFATGVQGRGLRVRVTFEAVTY